MDGVRQMERGAAKRGSTRKSRGRRVRVFPEIDAQDVTLARDNAMSDVAHDATY
jgi:hypothetical protein